jgi:hypothetical protein
MTVLAAAGWAAILGTTQTNMGVYMAYNDASTTLTITTANPSNPRIDIVVVTVSDAYYTGSLNTVAFSVIAGTPAASPVAPATPANSILLATIAVAAATTAITTANITDNRVLATSPTASVTLTNTVTLTNKTVSGPNFTQTGTNSIGSLPDTIMNLIMGAM